MSESIFWSPAEIKSQKYARALAEIWIIEKKNFIRYVYQLVMFLLTGVSLISNRFQVKELVPLDCH